MDERDAVKLPRFARELRQPYKVPPGSFESALMVLKRVFDNETLGVSDTSFWNYIEHQVTMRPREACFQYYLAGTGHLTLANSLLNHFPNFKSARLSGDMPPGEVDEKVNKLADTLLLLYPPVYREKIANAKKKPD
jgi:hypothetical protein